MYNSLCVCVSVGVCMYGKMNAQKYKQTLQEKLMSYDYIFLQDNDPKHTGKSMKKWLSENNVNVLQWPNQSLGLNLIGNLWWFLKIQIRKRAPANINNLKINMPGRMVQNIY